MPSSYTTRARFILQATGENTNVWGGLLNTSALQLIDDNVNGALSFTLSGPKTLTTANGATDEARMAILNVTGGSGGTITIPPVSKVYQVRNASSGQVIVTAGATSATIESGEIGGVICDGTNVHRIRPTSYGGAKITNVADPTANQDVATKAYVDATAFNGANLPGQGPGTVNAYLKSNGTVANWAFPTVSEVTGAAPAASPTFTGAVTVNATLAVTGTTTIAGATTVTGAGRVIGSLVIEGTDSFNVVAVGGVNIDLSSGPGFTKSISSNTTFTFSGSLPDDGVAFFVKLTISSGAVDTWPANVDFENGTKPVLGNGTHYLGFITMDGGTQWLMKVVGRNVS